jgi:molybdate transport system regulatory protein
MNRLHGTISQIQHAGAVVLVDFTVDDYHFSALLVESVTVPTWLKVGEKLDFVFKETEVSLAKNLSGKISSRNRIPCILHNIQRGELMSVLELRFRAYTITAAITTRSVDALELALGDEIEALVKSNEISLMQTFR